MAKKKMPRQSASGGGNDPEMYEIDKQISKEAKRAYSPDSGHHMKREALAEIDRLLDERNLLRSIGHIAIDPEVENTDDLGT